VSASTCLLAWGVVTLIVGFFAGKLAATAIEAIKQNRLGELRAHTGIFLLTTLPRVTPLAANVAAATGVGVNLILWLFFPNVFWFWWNAIGAVVTVSVGVMLACCCPIDGKVGARWPGRLRVRFHFAKAS